jgi:hypothetical protein
MAEWKLRVGIVLAMAVSFALGSALTSQTHANLPTQPNGEFDVYLSQIGNRSRDEAVERLRTDLSRWLTTGGGKDCVPVSISYESWLNETDGPESVSKYQARAMVVYRKK